MIRRRRSRRRRAPTKNPFPVAARSSIVDKLSSGSRAWPIHQGDLAKGGLTTPAPRGVAHAHQTLRHPHGGVQSASHARPGQGQPAEASRETTYLPDAALRRTGRGAEGISVRALQARAGPRKPNNRPAGRRRGSTASCTRQGNAQDGVEHSDPQKGPELLEERFVVSPLAQLAERWFAEP